MLVRLASTVSLSAMFAMIFTSIALILFSRDRVKSAMTVIAVAVLVAGLYFAFPQVGVARFIVMRLGTLPPQ